MKKYTKFFSITLTLLAATFLVISSPISAKGQTQYRVQDATTHEDGTEPTQEQDMLQDGSGDESETGGMRKGIENAIENLTRVVNRNNNPQVGEQLRVMTENHAEMQVKTQTALKNMNARSRALKFIFGPSYQSAGEVKKYMAQIRADVDELTAVKEELTSSTDQAEVQSAIDELEAEADALEDELAGTLRGFSLFGWLNKILSGY